jgi:PAS domain S-box-containing protein
VSEQSGERGSEALLRLERARDELRQQKERLEREIAERLRVERELQQSRERYRELVEHQGEGIGIMDPEERFTFANPAAHEIFGVEPGRLAGRSLATFLDQETLERVQRQTEARRAGEESTYEIPITRPDGEERVVLVTATPRHDEEGRFLATFGIFRDITERKRAEQELAFRNQLWESLLANTPDLVYFKDANHGLIMASQAYADAVDRDREDLVGKTAAELWPHEAEEIMADERRVLDGEPLIRKEREVTLASGERHWYTLTKVPIRQDGAVVGFFATDKDITERRRAERALRENELLLRQVIDTSPSCIFVKDWDGEYVLVNDAIAELYNTSKEEMVGKTDRELAGLDRLSPEQAESFLADDREVMSQQQPKFIPEEPFTLADGTIRWFQTAKVPLTIGDAPTRLLGVAVDITARKDMEETLRQQERLAALGQMAAGVAHDFRNRLNPIILYAGMAQKAQNLPPHLSRGMEVILEEAEGMADLVQQILDFTSRAMIHRQPLDLGALADEVVAALRPKLPGDVRVSVAKGPGRHVVLADRERIRQALTNLALNARDAMPEGGELRVELSSLEVGADEPPPLKGMAPGGWICLAVSDTGIGMTEEVRAHLFEPFFTTKGVDQGPGLGLPQVHGIVRQHEGIIDMGTELGQGTTFRIYLPAYRGEGDETSAREPSAPQQGQEETILLVEVDEALREAGRALLDSLGYLVLTAANGSEALALCQSPRWSGGGSRLDLLVADVVMPDIGGEALMRLLRRSHPDLRGLALSDCAVEDVKDALAEAGFVGVIQKPFEAEELAHVVRQALERG